MANRIAPDPRSQVWPHDAQCGAGYGVCSLRHRCERYLREATGTWRGRFHPSVLHEDCEHFVPVDADE
jgi:hypothetical protein